MPFNNLYIVICCYTGHPVRYTLVTIIQRSESYQVELLSCSLLNIAMSVDPCCVLRGNSFLEQFTVTKWRNIVATVTY